MVINILGVSYPEFRLTNIIEYLIGDPSPERKEWLELKI